MSDRILKLPAVSEKTGKGRSSIYAAVATHDFPSPVKLGSRAVGWLESEIDAWLESRKSVRFENWTRATSEAHAAAAEEEAHKRITALKSSLHNGKHSPVSNHVKGTRA